VTTPRSNAPDSPGLINHQCRSQASRARGAGWSIKVTTNHVSGTGVSGRQLQIVAALPHSTHTTLFDSAAPVRHQLGAKVHALSQRDHTGSPRSRTRGGPSTVHGVPTQASSESWDALTNVNVHKIVALLLDDDIASPPSAASTRRSSSASDGKVQVCFGNLCAARVHHFASSL
jgi:hypothetical protein